MGWSSPVFPWRLWCATAAAAFIFFSFTLTSAVPVWIDDTFIVEYGRVTLAGDPPGFSYYQRSDSGRPMYAYALLGVVLPEIAYRMTAPSNAGPRALALLGQLAAFGFFLYYLRLRGVDRRWSALLGLALLLDPLCDIGWRGGRVDGWAFACLFACLSAIRARASFWGGVAAASGMLWWSSFAMFAPLVLLEIWPSSRGRFDFWKPLLWFGLGGIAAGVLIIAPFRREFLYGIADAGLLTSLQAQGSRNTGIGQQFQALFWSFAQTPVVVVAGLFALARRRNFLVLVGFLVALVFVFGTLVYRLRVLYLLPFLYLAVATLFFDPVKSGVCVKGTIHRFLWSRLDVGAVSCRVMVVLMLIGGFGFTVVGTTLSGLSDRSGKDPLGLIEPARSAVGSGAMRVFMREPDLYFTGRALGWRQFRCFDGCFGSEARVPEYLRMLATMEYAIFRGEPDAATRVMLDRLGFRFKTVMLPDGGRRSRMFGWSYGPPAYGPYFVYKK